MPTGYNARKAAQVIAYFASKSPNHRLHVVKAAKLVYLADRESIARTGFPILDEGRVSMRHGPVNSTTYSHINGEYDLDDCGWSEFLRDRSNHQVSVKRKAAAESDWDELSDAEIECLDGVWERFGTMDEWSLARWTHKRTNVPEWEDPGNSSYPIPLERIMSVLGLENADEQAEIAEAHRKIDGLFASLRK
jgi:uncharacterized phage-associated protein